MNADQAKQELAELEPKERLAWIACEAKRVERDVFEKLWWQEHQKLQEQWSPMYQRVHQLKAFLEIELQ